jgi:hypothetical protein
MNLLAPEVVGPLSVCSTSVEVRGNIAGATVEILVNGNIASSHVSTVADNFYSIGAVLQANQKVTARQTFSGATSPDSLPVIVESVPSQLSALTVQTNLHSCGRAMWASGAVPGANVQALIGNQAVGSANSANGDAVIICNPTVPTGQNLTLRQTACNNATASQVTPVAVAPPPLPAPQIQQPLIECQNSISIAGVVDGAYVEMYRNNDTVPEQTFIFGLSQEWFWIKPLANNDVIKVRQGFSCKQPGPPLETASPFGSATVQPISKLNAPQFLADACPGTTYVTLGSLIPGARVVLSQNGQEIGQTDAPSVTYTFTTPPLQAGATLEAHMEMCGGKKGPSAKTTVASQPQSPLGLKISDPYACAAHVYVKVTGYPGNYLVFISNQNGQQISAYHNLIGFDALIPVSPSLVAGEQITVNLQGCGGNWTKFGPFAVIAGAPPQPVFVQPVQAGYTFCEIASPAAGSIINVYTATNQWLGSAISKGNLESTGVPLSATLQVGQQLHCTQTLCGVPGKPTPNVTVTKQHPKAPVLLQPPNGAHNVDLQPVFQWKDPGAGTPASADSFHIQAMPGAGVNASVAVTSFQPSVPLNQGTTYHWQVTATNSAGQASSAMFGFETKLPPKANLHFMPPITSSVGDFPRDTLFVISIEVINGGNAASQPYSVRFEIRDHTDSILYDHATDAKPALGPGANTLASATIQIHDPNTVFLHAFLLVNNQQIESAFRAV